MPVGRTADGAWQVGVRRTFRCDVHTAWRLLPSLLDGDPAVGAIRSRTTDRVMRLGTAPMDRIAVGDEADDQRSCIASRVVASGSRS